MFNIFKKNHNQQIIEQPSIEGNVLNERVNKLEKDGRRRGRIYLVVGISASFLAAMIAMYASQYILEDIISITGKLQENIAGIPEKRNSQKKIALFDEWKKCLNNSDCAETREDCCSCNSGGTQTAINLLYLDEWEKNLNENCGNRACITLYACQEGKAVCEDNKCEFAEHDNEKSCISAGESADKYSHGIYIGSNSCCEGLLKIPVKDYKDGECYNLFDVGTVCSECGNSICEEWENKCNCPEDCDEEFDMGKNRDEQLKSSCLDEQCSNLIDSDDDGLSDYDENNIYFTNSELSDTDNDGYSDGDEVKNGYNPAGEGKLLIF